MSLAVEPPEAALNQRMILDDDDMHHVVNGLSLEVTRQAERIRRRSHGQDWPGAASAMSELQEAVEILGRMVDLTLRASLTPSASAPEPAGEEPPELPVGQYL